MHFSAFLYFIQAKQNRIQMLLFLKMLLKGFTIGGVE